VILGAWVPARFVHNDRLRTRGVHHNPALRQLANRRVGILQGCLKTRTLYNEAAAWPHRAEKAAV
jgi:hypothetical protein